LWQQLRDETVLHEKDEDWLAYKRPILLRRCTTASILKDILAVSAEIANVEYKSFLEHPDIKL
jgi:hypothetical protein